MPFRRTTIDPTVTLDLSEADLGPPPDRLAVPPPQRRPVTTAPVSRAEINGLAGLCMLVLVVTGLGLPLPGGHLAADAILVVVGFQLGLGVTRLAGGSPRWLRRFWLSAIGPIMAPAVIAIGLVTAYWWWLDRLGPTEVRGAVASLAMATNLTPALADTGFAATDHLWLISLIVQFALLAPLAALVTRRANGRRTMVHIVITLAAVVIVTRLMLTLTSMTAPSTLAQLPLTRFDGLLIGLGVAVAPRSLTERLPAIAAPLAAVSMLAVFALAPLPDQRPAVSLGALIPVVVLASAIIVASRTPDRSDTLSRLLGGLGPRWLGERAISIFIWHQLFGMAIDDMAATGLFAGEWPGPSLFVTRLVFALAAGAASYRYLQLPVRSVVGRVAGRRQRRQPEPAAAMATSGRHPASALSPS